MSTQIDQLQPRVRRVLRYCAVLGRSFRREVLNASSPRTTWPSTPPCSQPCRPSSRPMAKAGSAFATAWFGTRPTRGSPSGYAPGSTGWLVRSSRPSAPTSTPTRRLSSCTSRAPATPNAPGDSPRWPGELARRSYANADAADHFETALDVSRRVPGVTETDRARLWTMVGQLRELAGMFEASVDAYRRAARVLRDDPVARAGVLDLQATVHTRTGELATAMQVVARARRMLDGAGAAGRPTIVRLDSLTARIRVEQERLGDAMAWAERAAAGAREIGDRRSSDPVADLLGHGRAPGGCPRPRRAPPGSPGDLRRGGVATSRGDRRAETWGRWRTTPVAGPRRRSGTPRPVRWRSRSARTSGRRRLP